MNDKSFLDTNILIYAIESGGPDPSKTAVAQSLVLSGQVVISTQVLGEFYAATTSARRASPLSRDQAVSWIAFWKSLPVQAVTLSVVEMALGIAVRYQLGYYDSLILAAASAAGCNRLYSEDLSNGQSYFNVTVHNPFVNAIFVP